MAPQPEKPPSTDPDRQTQEIINQLLIEQKLRQELQDLKRPYLFRNPQLLTALITSIGAIIGVSMLVSENYFKVREVNNALQERETKRLNEEATEAARHAAQVNQDASRIIAAANQTKAEAEKRIRESKLETKAADDQLLATRRQLNDVKGDLALAHAQELLASALRDDSTFRIRNGSRTRDVDILPKGEQDAIYEDFSKHDAEFQRQLNAAQQAAVETWSVYRRSDTRDAVVRAYSFPIISIASADPVVQYLPGGRRFVSSGAVFGIRTWDAANGRPLAEHTTWSALAGDRLAIAIGDKRVFDVATEQELANWGWLPKDADVLDVSPAFGRLVTGTIQKEKFLVQFWDAPMHRELFHAEFGPLKFQSDWRVSISPDGRLLLVLSYPGGEFDPFFHVGDSRRGFGQQIHSTDSQVRQLFDAQTGRRLTILESSTKVWRTSFSPDGRRIVATTSNTAGIWDSITGKQLVEAPHAGIESALFFRDGTRILTSGNGTQRVWEAATGRLLASFNGRHDSANLYTEPQVSIDGKRALTSDGTVWETATGNPLSRLERRAGDASGFNSVALSPDGQYVVTTSGPYDESNIQTLGRRISVYKIVAPADVERLFAKQK